MGSEFSKEGNKSDSFDEKRAEMMAAVEQEAVHHGNSQDKYLTQAMATLDLDEGHIKEHYSKLSPRTLGKFSEHFWQDKKNELAMNALMNNDPGQILLNRESALQNRHVFNVKIELEGAATNQKQSGRCWIFAGFVK